MSDPTARRKAMADAIAAKEDEPMRRPNWDAIGRRLELAVAADEARDAFERQQESKE